MSIKSFFVIGCIVLAATPLRAQTNQPQVYWAAAPPNCTSLGGESPVVITGPGGGVLGYSCWLTGTFPWLASGGVWSTVIRLAAPASGAVGVDYSFYSTTGGLQSLDVTLDNLPKSAVSGKDVPFSLNANQPSEVEVLGGTNDAPDYNVTAEGSIYAVFYCPDAATCSKLQPQLIYSALPTYPWSLSVPIAWDTELSSQWSAVAIDDGKTNVVGLVVYNDDVTATSFAVNVYDSTGKLFGSATTPMISGFQPNSYEGGTYSTLLSQLISPLPSGPFKILVDGRGTLCAVNVLQINGSSATTLQVAFDSAPRTTGVTAMKPFRTSAKSLQVASRPHVVIPPLKN